MHTKLDNYDSCDHIDVIISSLCGTATTRRVRSNATNRNGTNAVGGNNRTGRKSTIDNLNSKRRQATSSRRRYSSARRESQYHEVQISMLPDLSGEQF